MDHGGLNADFFGCFCVVGGAFKWSCLVRGCRGRKGLFVIDDIDCDRGRLLLRAHGFRSGRIGDRGSIKTGQFQ